MLEKEFEYYLKNQDELLKKFNDRFIVLKNNEILGDYSSEIEALSETRKSHEVGTFLIQHCTPGTNSYTETYHSRVVLNG
ncbi:hypothetical protein ABW636_18455 [Aquimarina sp. 2201CG1-2-11]|uniref:hypothetical protein n=1 Tax=Aquimarina discodermiae TaxID=3231043 RepID=UPI003463189D